MARKVRNTSAKGRRKEHQVRDIFTRKGYYVIRSAGSLGWFDLIALPSNLIDRNIEVAYTTAIQYKPKPFTEADKSKLTEARKHLAWDVRIEAWVIPDRKEPYLEFQL